VAGRTAQYSWDFPEPLRPRPKTGKLESKQTHAELLRIEETNGACMVLILLIDLDTFELLPVTA